MVRLGIQALAFTQVASGTPRAQHFAQSQVHFGRAFTPQEEQDNFLAVQAAQKLLDIERMAIIVPIRSLPTRYNTGMGSLYGAKEFLRFIRKQGYTHVQLDPGGSTYVPDISPYDSAAFSRNPYQFATEMLEEPRWGLLPAGYTQAEITGKIKGPYAQSRLQIDQLKPLQDKALNLAYTAFKTSPDNDPLKQQFEEFKKDNQTWLEPDALYDVLCERYKNPYWKNWQGTTDIQKVEVELDKRLYCIDDTKDHPALRQARLNRIKELKKTYAETFERYQFIQFVVAQQQKELKAFCDEIGQKLVADLPVNILSKRDAWRSQDFIHPDYVLGVPPDYFSAKGQPWGFPFIDPAKLFNKNGTINQKSPAAQYLKAVFRKIFTENHAVRLDHTVGLVDPWIYQAGAETTKKGFRAFSSPEHPIGRVFSRIGLKALNPQAATDQPERVKASALKPIVLKRYQSLIADILLPEAQKAGIQTQDLMFEDLGTLTNPVQAVMDQLNLPGLRVTQFVNPTDPKDPHKGKNVAAKNWLALGTHDNPPLRRWLARLNPEALEGLRKRLSVDVQGWPKKLLPKNLQVLTNAMFTEWLMSPARNVQIFFEDWLGGDRLYNDPGVKPGKGGHGRDRFWKVRVPHDYKKAYYTAVSAPKELALNLPGRLADALRLKAKQTNNKLSAQATQTLVELDKHAAILAEPSDVKMPPTAEKA